MLHVEEFKSRFMLRSLCHMLHVVSLCHMLHVEEFVSHVAC